MMYEGQTMARLINGTQWPFDVLDYLQRHPMPGHIDKESSMKTAPRRRGYGEHFRIRTARREVLRRSATSRTRTGLTWCSAGRAEESCSSGHHTGASRSPPVAGLVRFARPTASMILHCLGGCDGLGMTDPPRTHMLCPAR